MSERESMPGAFPFVSNGGAHEHQYIDSGMTLLDWFAGQALCGVVAAAGYYDRKLLSTDAYNIAEAMLVERAKRMEVQL